MFTVNATVKVFTSFKEVPSILNVISIVYSKQDKIRRSLTDPVLDQLQQRQGIELPELRCTFLGAKNVGKTAIITSLE